MIKLNFNFKMQNHRGQDMGLATNALISGLESSISQDKKYIDKINAWCKSLAKDGTVECDLTDAKELNKIVETSLTMYVVTKPFIMDYLEKRIDQATPKK